MRKAILCLTLCFFLTGCRDEKIIEQMGFARTLAYDTANPDGSGNLLRITISIPQAQPHHTRILLSTTARSSKEARLIFTRENNRQVVSGQLRTALFGEKLSSIGLWHHVDSLVRDPSIGNTVSVVVVEGDANDLLESEFSQYPSTGEYIETLIRSGSRANEIPSSNLYTFTRDFMDKGIDPVAPILKASKESIKLDGLALFREDRYVGKVEPRDSLLIASMMGRVHSGELAIPVPSENGEESDIVIMSFMSSKRKITISHKQPIKSGSDLNVVVHMKLRGSLLEYTGTMKLQEAEIQKKMEAMMSAYLEKEGTRIIKMMQQLSADSLGIGQYARNEMSYAQWERTDWHAFFSRANIKVVADVKIKDLGKVQQ
ncbi:Ger(x)C family spore germination protein [Paenibacillus sepulcri]|uniref:Ger(X)C family spore germination protein n=1 Tax=Paenibacillus sepulcri TaxID=359917 RepID=A0ABS7C798_9BACL|nr:Ger(x)C family spore germination protein [Paenibacillus sepulcri]